MTEAFVSLGSNMGDAAGHVRQALKGISALPDVAVEAVSPLYWTEPQGMRGQPWFANCVARLACAPIWTAPALLERLLALEKSMGRVRSGDAALRFGPRVIDLDLLIFGHVHSAEPTCMLPHPRLMQRAFVLVPLRDIAPQVILAGGKTPEAALKALAHRVQGDKIYQ